MARRILVASPRSSCRGGAPLLQTGLLRYRSPPVRLVSRGLIVGPRPTFAIIVKATYSFAHCRGPEDAMQLAEAPERLARDVPWELPGAAADIAYASDFVPRKPACDVLLHGHAHAGRSSTRFLAGIEVAEVARDFIVKAASAGLRAPLLAASILSPDGDAPAERVGPAATPALPDSFPEDFDFSFFCAAPPAMRTATSPLGKPLILRGLSARDEERIVTVPDVTPAVFVERAGRPGAPVAMACDTLWIDTDRELCVLVFRGQIPADSLDPPRPFRLTVAFAPLAAPLPSAGAAFADPAPLEPGGCLVPAAELADFDDGAAAALGAEEAALEKYLQWGARREPALSLEQYALIAAALAERPDKRAETLRHHDQDEGSFLAEERGWLERMAGAAAAGDTAMIARYGALFVAAQDALAAPSEGQESIDLYVEHKVEIEDARDLQAALAARRLTFAAWMRMDRQWQRRAIAERALAADIERRARLYRERRGATER